MCLDNRIHCRKTKINLNPDNMENLELHWTTVEDKLRSFIIGKVQDRMIADDILQEVFIKIHSKIDTLKDSTKIQHDTFCIILYILYIRIGWEISSFKV